VDVGIDERGREQQAVCLDHAVRVRVEVGSERGHDTVVDPDVEHRIHAGDRIEHARAAYDEVFLGCRLGEQHHATSSAEAVLTSTGPVVSRS
jgi:hypothetical protein